MCKQDPPGGSHDLSPYRRTATTCTRSPLTRVQNVRQKRLRPILEAQFTFGEGFGGGWRRFHASKHPKAIKRYRPKETPPFQPFSLTLVILCSPPGVISCFNLYTLYFSCVCACVRAYVCVFLGRIRQERSSVHQDKQVPPLCCIPEF